MHKNASYALRFAEKCRYVKVADPASALVDDVIVRVAEEWKVALFSRMIDSLGRG